MMLRIFLLMLLTLGPCPIADAAEPVTAGDRVVGGTFKTMAKAFIAAADLRALKEKNIQRIEIMRPDWFRRQYADVYAVIGQLPPKLRSKYGLHEGMTKAQVIAVIRSLDKNKIYEIIDAVPDQMISSRFNEQMHAEGAGDKDLMARIRTIWARVVAAVNAPSAR